MTNKITRRAAIVICVLVLVISSIPLNAVYALDGYGNIEIQGLEAIDVKVKDTYQQIKNATIIHLFNDMMYRCANKFQILNVYQADPFGSPIIWSNRTKETVAEGEIFVDRTSLIGTDWSFGTDSQIYAGTWITSHIDPSFSSDWGEANDGQIFCQENNGKIFQMYAYVMDSYHNEDDSKSDSNITAIDNNSIVIDWNTILKYICDGDHSRLLQSSNILGFPVETTCPSASNYTGRHDNSKTIEALKDIYNEFYERNNNWNKYLTDWDSITQMENGYSGKELYYLWYLEQSNGTCGSTFTSNANGSSKRINEETGAIEIGDWTINSDVSDKAWTYIRAFNGETVTCTSIYQRMTETATDYLHTINRIIYEECKSVIDNAIANQVNKLETDETIKNSNSKETIDALKEEYISIQTKNQYVIKAQKQATEEDDSLSTPTNDSGANKIEEEIIENPNPATDNIVYACRSTLPYINVETEFEPDLEPIVNDVFKRDECKENLDLGWVICPALRAITDAAYHLEQWIEEAF